MKILGLNTSPRSKSNVKLAMEIAFDEASKNGAETKIINTNRLKINPCRGDNHCKEHDSQCAINDKMQDIYKEIEDSDVIVIGTPIYFRDFSAQAKIIMDRMYAYFMNEKFQNLFGNKTVYFITSNGFLPVEEFKPTLDLQMDNFAMLGFNKGEILSLTNNNEPEAIREKEDQLEQIHEFGKNLV